ncbi:hypothetical protein [Corynebacterium liangguodongii]|uniref:Uncharacterized protein n=1 Tax=Corynebacterium liangguodongii TaxID=2079535 RepID=A0A2S0WFX0_9CORY|nr:hypothetical protein [Corynebacterium liangguodongii]AWB84673.1 hypothetical protein C3E79_09480 [Corynebacterium liangguodongii]PWB99681.1 hypothetical protein DF219_05260 [Corynebacterium liangguodongii]
MNSVKKTLLASALAAAVAVSGTAAASAEESSTDLKTSSTSDSAQDSSNTDGSSSKVDDTVNGTVIPLASSLIDASSRQADDVLRGAEVAERIAEEPGAAPNGSSARQLAALSAVSGSSVDTAYIGTQIGWSLLWAGIIAAVLGGAYNLAVQAGLLPAAR